MPRDWISEIAALRSLPPSEASRQIREILVQVGGRPVGLRVARSTLFLTSVAVSGGSPKVLEINENEIVIIALDDFAGILCDTAFEDFMRKAATAGKKVGRRRVSNR